MANLNNNVDRFFICVCIIVLVVQCSLAFGCFLSAVAPSTNVGKKFVENLRIKQNLNFYKKKALALAGPILVPVC